jgi:hypothetical protein
MKVRSVLSEILDHLPAGDPEAVRSRRDLRRINFLMGNERWICRSIRKFSDAAAHGIVELGAGDGSLISKLVEIFSETDLTATDLVPRPPTLDPRVRWRQGDLLSDCHNLSGGMMIANLFLHHFEGEPLLEIGKLCERFEVLVFCEPDRALIPHLLGFFMWPWVNRVTRHDMHVSINSGFSKGELPALLGLKPERWEFSETSTWRGGRRVLGWRNS